MSATGVTKYHIKLPSGNFRLVLNQSFKNRSALSFLSIIKFHQIINKVTTRSSYPYEDEIYDEDDVAEWLKLVVIVGSWSDHPLINGTEMLSKEPFH